MLFLSQPRHSGGKKWLVLVLTSLGISTLLTTTNMFPVRSQNTKAQRAAMDLKVQSLINIEAENLVLLAKQNLKKAQTDKWCTIKSVPVPRKVPVDGQTDAKGKPLMQWENMDAFIQYDGVQRSFSDIYQGPYDRDSKKNLPSKLPGGKTAIQKASASLITEGYCLRVLYQEDKRLLRIMLIHDMVAFTQWIASLKPAEEPEVLTLAEYEARKAKAQQATKA